MLGEAQSTDVSLSQSSYDDDNLSVRFAFIQRLTGIADFLEIKPLCICWVKIMVADELEDAVYQFLCRIVAEITGKIDSFRVSLMGLKLFSLKTPSRIPVSQTMPPFFYGM